MSLSLRAMRYVQSALKQGSISAAAEEMNVAPSAIATALDQAEAAFSVTLVTRARAKGIFPTAAGRQALRSIEDLLERYDALMSDLSDLQGGLSGNLAIGYNAPIAPAFLPEIASEMVKHHPEISISFTEGNNTTVQEALIDGRLDVIIFVEEIPSPLIASQPLIFAPTYCLCPEAHPLAAAKTASIVDVAKQPLILLDRPAAHRYYMELLEKSREELKIVAMANSTEMVRSLVASGMGLSLLNMRPRETTPYFGADVKCLPLSDAQNGVTLSLGFAPGPKRRLVQMFAGLCEEFFSGPKGRELIVERC